MTKIKTSRNVGILLKLCKTRNIQSKTFKFQNFCKTSPTFGWGKEEKKRASNT